MQKQPNIPEILQNQLQIGFWKELSGFDEKMLDKTISVFGIGGSGSPLVLTLVRMGFRRIILIDKDVVEAKNLTRQVLYSLGDIGLPKPDAARRQLELNHSFQSEFETYHMDIILNLDKTEAIIQKSDFVFNLVDNEVALYHVSRLSRKHKKASIFFGTGVIAGMTSMMLYQPSESGACHACLKGLPTDLKEIQQLQANRKLGITPSWYPTPALGAAFATVILVKSLLGKKISVNYFLTSLFAIEVDKLQMSGKAECRICGVG